MKKQEVITIKTYGGLANRMRALKSVYCLAKKLNKPVFLIWENSFELKCSYSSLFKAPNDLEYSEYAIARKILSVKNRLIKLFRKTGVNLPLGYDIHLYNKEIKELKRKDFNFEELKKSKRIYISTVEEFYNETTNYYIFKPIEKLQNKIDYYVNQFSKNTIGIHVRRGDNSNATKFSPISEFIKIMEAEIKNDKHSRFFLATDSQEVEEVMKAKFGDKLFTHKKVLDRNSEKGIQDALIDIYCLANCKKIIGSHYSSFSEVASYIGNIELKQVYKD